MISLLVLVFLVHLAIYVVNTIGASTIDNLVLLHLPQFCAQTLFREGIVTNG